MDTEGRRVGSLVLAVVLFATALPQAALAISLPTIVPTANPDAYSTLISLSVPAPGVLANDSGSNLSAILVTGPSHAASFSYTPTPAFSGIPGQDGRCRDA